MATRNGPEPGDLTHFERLCQAPQGFHIFHALRVIEAHFADDPPMGASARPREDKIRLGQEAELAFPRTTIRHFSPPGGQGPGVLTNRFFGLFGQHGALPAHLTEYAHERQTRHRDPTFVDFVNMLTHRMMTLLYRAWATGQPAVSFDRGEAGRIERAVAALAGHHGVHLRRRDAMPDLAKRYFAGHLSLGTKTAEGLVSMLGCFFRAPVKLQQFVGSWLELEPGDRWQLGGRAGLGQATSIGTKVWSRSSKFRLCIGPLSLEEYRRILPGGGSLKRLSAIVRNHVGDALDWEVNLVLRADQVPAAILGQDTRLGHTSWIGARTPDRDAADLFLAPQYHAELAAGAAPHEPEGRDTS
ncbi:MAG: type VI secretion system baseplate subunit TssG [Rhodobacteraceae bacterium]|nr:type VI secretion system baseplate subunit TssG [Paracoccaceae bacterium]MCP5342837.1 type VI secretion system baseplate subunit TssG [Paracoccaceae bacterium]